MSAARPTHLAPRLKRSPRRRLSVRALLLAGGLVTVTALLVVARTQDAAPVPEEVERVDPANYHFEVTATEDDVAGLRVAVLFIDLVGKETAIPFLPDGREGFATEVDGNVVHLMRISHALQVERNERLYGKRVTWTQLAIPLGERVASGGRFERSVTCSPAWRRRAQSGARFSPVLCATPPRSGRRRPWSSCASPSKFSRSGTV